MIVTAKGHSADVVSRFFYPGGGIDEDPVTGSAHSQLIPFWNSKLGKTTMKIRLPVLHIVVSFLIGVKNWEQQKFMRNNYPNVVVIYGANTKMIES